MDFKGPFEIKRVYDSMTLVVLGQGLSAVRWNVSEDIPIWKPPCAIIVLHHAGWAPRRLDNKPPLSFYPKLNSLGKE